MELDIFNLDDTRFVPLDDLPSLPYVPYLPYLPYFLQRPPEVAEAAGLKAIFLRAPVGIDLCPAGPPASAEDWLRTPRTDARFTRTAHRDKLDGHTVVSCCNDDIRCEKAARVMQSQGLDHRYLLDGGAWKYFQASAGQAPGRHGRYPMFDAPAGLHAALAA